MKWAAAIFSLFIVFVIVQAGRGELPDAFRALVDYPGGDHVGHFILIGTLSFLINSALTWNKKNDPLKTVLITSSVITLAITLEEFSQLFLDNRQFSLYDLAANYAGIVVFSLAAYFLARRRFRET